MASLAVSAGLAASAPAADFTLQSASVTPAKTAYFDGEDPIELSFRFAASGPTDVSVRIAGNGKEVRGFDLKALEPGAEHELVWDGLTSGRKAAPDGTYKFLVGPAGGKLTQVAKVSLRGHFFPIRGPHGTRGGVGEFHAPRNGGRIHEGFDVTARCGTRLVAARGGTVVRRRFHPSLDGNYVVISGRKEDRTYRYSHLTRPAEVAKGDRVFTGQLIGFVGRTGNAASTPCHLHFELRAPGRGFLDPEPFLRAWDRFS